MSKSAIVVTWSPSGNHVKVLCPCNREHWTGREQDVMCHECGHVVHAETATEREQREVTS
jgi:hypothetical protein